MTWESIVVALIVAAAAGYLIRQTWKTWSKKSGCGGSCGCSSSKDVSATNEGQITLIPSEQIILRRSQSE